MKTDRELLELAAKAAGIEINGWITRGTGYCWALLQKNGYKAEWNPLEDDGDALRLAVKVSRFPVCLVDGKGVLTGYLLKDGNNEAIAELFGSDPLSATRRAIVRAAAAIGEKMP